MRYTFLSLILLLLLPAMAFGLEAETLRVPKNYKSIQAAVDNARPLDTILVERGVYNENVVITKPITIRVPEGAGPVVVRALNEGESVIRVINVSGSALIGLTVTGSHAAGIYLDGAANTLVEANIAQANNTGIMLNNSDTNSLISNTAIDNEVYGIYLENSNGNKVEDNRADSNRDKGIFLSYSNNNLVAGNTADLNTWVGILLWSSNNNELLKNQTLRNPYGVLSSKSKENVLKGNTTMRNIHLIMPILLVYFGILSYWTQRSVLRMIYNRG